MQLDVSSLSRDNKISLTNIYARFFNETTVNYQHDNENHIETTEEYNEWQLGVFN